MTDKTGNRYDLAEVNEIKDLGILVSKDLSTSSHVDMATSSANKALYRGMYHLNKATGPYLLVLSKTYT